MHNFKRGVDLFHESMLTGEITMDEKNRKYFKLGLIAAVIIITIIAAFLFISANAQTTRTILFENGVYIFDSDTNFNGDVNVQGVILGQSLLKIRQGISIVDSDFNPLFDIFVAKAPNTVIKSAIPQTADSALVIQRTGVQNSFFIDVVFWDSDSNRPLFVVNAGDPGRASTFDRSLQIGKDHASDIIDSDYTICNGTSLADCDTLLTGADLIVEDDIENFGSLQVHENAIIDGNISFTGSFGELFQNEFETIVLISDANVFFQIDNFEAGNSSNAILNDMNISHQIPGFYLVNYSISFSNANNQNYTGTIMVNGVPISSGRSSRRLAANDLGNMSGTAILNLGIDDNLGIGILNQTFTSNPTIKDATITSVYIGTGS